jgi:hypothetical protein
VGLKAQQIQMIKNINNLIKSVFGLGTTAWGYLNLTN